MTDLIQRCEQADEGMQRELLVEAWLVVHGSWERCNVTDANIEAFMAWERERLPFDRKLDAEAFVDAALMLVPEGVVVRLIFDRPGRAKAGVNDPGCIAFDGHASTPALAIVSARLKAREASNG